MPRPGELWVADIEYTNGLSTKRRPALVLWTDGTDCIVAAVTSATPKSPTDVELSDWETAGLARQSTVRLLRLDVFAGPRLTRYIGQVSSQDAATLNRVWAENMVLRL